MKRDNRRAAMVLVDAVYLGDQKAAEKWDITTRTIQNYRDAMLSDPELSSFFATFHHHAQGDWASELDAALKEGIGKLRHYASHADDPSADGIKAMSELVKTLSEIALTRDVLNASNANQNSGVAASAREVKPAQAIN